MNRQQRAIAFTAKKHLDAALSALTQVDVLAIGLSNVDRKIIHMQTAEAFNLLQKVRRRLE